MALKVTFSKDAPGIRSSMLCLTISSKAHDLPQLSSVFPWNSGLPLLTGVFQRKSRPPKLQPVGISTQPAPAPSGSVASASPSLENPEGHSLLWRCERSPRSNLIERRWSRRQKHRSTSFHRWMFWSFCSCFYYTLVILVIGIQKFVVLQWNALKLQDTERIC